MAQLLLIIRHRYWEANLHNRVALGFGAALLVLAASLPGPASATIIVSTSGGGTGINAVSANCTGSTNSPGTTIDGCLNGHPGTDVQFASDVSIQFDASGQAVIAASPPLSAYDFLKISLPGYTFDTLILNVEAVTNGTIQFGDNFGDVSGSFTLDPNGNNFFTITGDNFGFVDFHTYGTDVTVELVDAQDTKQVRFDGILIPTCPECGIQFEQVPEPASIALFGGGLLFFGALRRRRRSPAI
jgi:WD40 repeat protein